MPKVLWSESFGKKAYKDRPTTKVRVFERADSPGRIYGERYWITGKERVYALKHGTTRKGAAAWAKKLSAMREENILKGLDEFGDRKAGRLFDLLKAYHDPRQNRKAKKWSERHRLEQERCRDFWKRELGDVLVEKLSQTVVEGAAGDASDGRKWTPRTEEKYLKYLMAATKWGKRKAKLFEVDPLAGMDLPEVRYDTRKRVYSLEHAKLLMQPHPGVDWRVTLAYALSAVHGRRISAILHLWAGKEGSDNEPDVAELEVTVGGEKVRRLFLHYRPEWDKGGLDEWVPAPEGLRPQIERALKQPEVIESGWLFPENRLGFEERRDKPMRADSMIQALHTAEETLGIPVVPRRGFHGAKRLHVTLGFQVAGGDATSVGDITGNVSEHVLRTIYRQKDLGRMVTQVDGVSALLG